MPRLTAASRVVLRGASLFRRAVTTLSNNPHIVGSSSLHFPLSRIGCLLTLSVQKVVDNPSSPASYVLTFLETEPPSQRLAIGTCTTLPPTPQSFRENPRFVDILNEVVGEHGHEDEGVVRQARALASPGSGRKQGAGGGAVGSGAEAASGQVGSGSGGLAGWVHLSDVRNPPDFGRIAWPEDILGSVQVDAAGQVVGRVQPSGTYRLVTNEGMCVVSGRGSLVACPLA